MSGDLAYALPLFSLVNKGKLDLSRPLPESLAEQLQLYMERQLGIELISLQLLVIGGDPYVILHGLAEESLPALCSLVDVQRTQLYQYERPDAETVTLTPLNVKI